MLAVVYAIPKDRADDMTGGRGLPVQWCASLTDALDYIERNSSPDNPDRYVTRDEAAS